MGGYIDMGYGRSYSEFTYFFIARNKIHKLWLRFKTRNYKNAVVVEKKVFEQSHKLTVDIRKSVRKEYNPYDGVKTVHIKEQK